MRLPFTHYFTCEKKIKNQEHSYISTFVLFFQAIGPNFRSEYKLNHHLGCSVKSTKFQIFFFNSLPYFSIYPGYILNIIVLSIGVSIPEFFKWQVIQEESEILNAGHETSTLKVIATEFNSDIGSKNKA